MHLLSVPCEASQRDCLQAGSAHHCFPAIPLREVRELFICEPSIEIEGWHGCGGVPLPAHSAAWSAVAAGIHGQSSNDYDSVKGQAKGFACFNTFHHSPPPCRVDEAAPPSSRCPRFMFPSVRFLSLRSGHSTPSPLIHIFFQFFDGNSLNVPQFIRLFLPSTQDFSPTFAACRIFVEYVSLLPCHAAIQHAEHRSAFLLIRTLSLSLSLFDHRTETDYLLCSSVLSLFLLFLQPPRRFALQLCACCALRLFHSPHAV
jgi:hypothetical protein